MNIIPIQYQQKKILVMKSIKKKKKYHACHMKYIYSADKCGFYTLTIIFLSFFPNKLFNRPKDEAEKKNIGDFLKTVQYVEIWKC